MTKSRGILAPRTRWTEPQLQLLRERYPDARTADLIEALGRTASSIYEMAHKLGLHKSQAFLSSINSGRTDGKIGHATRFAAGHVPANKGLRRPGWTAGRIAETQFKPGNRSGRAVQLYQPIGTERLSKDGYLERKINDDMPLQKRWRAVHLIIWEAAHGPLPKGHAVIFKDGDKTHIAIDNLQLVNRADLMRRNSYHQYGPEIARLVQLRGALSRQINKREHS